MNFSSLRRALLTLLGAACCVIIFACAATGQATSAQSSIREQRTLYRIDVEINFDERTYAGSSRLRWTNTGARPTNVLYFHLYANLRPDQQADDRGKENGKGGVSLLPDEPRIEILAVHSVSDNRIANTLDYSLDERGSALRVELNTSVAVGKSAEVEIKFRGSVPEVDAEETGLLAHVVQGVDAALRDSREINRARDFNFRSRGMMLLGAWYPVLAVRGETGEWQRKSELSLGRVMFAEAADYDVSLTLLSAPDEHAPMQAFAPGALKNVAALTTKGARRKQNFDGERLRDFPIVIGRNLRVAEEVIDGVRVRSIFPVEHERTGQRALDTARAAANIYALSFGRLPQRQITILAAPLVAGRGALKFSGMNVVASAFYVDFNAPAARNLPEIVREQRASVEDSLEWTIATGIAHQWWGAGAIGSDPLRQPVLDEGLAQWSALHYYRTRHGAPRAALALEDQLRGVYTVYRTFGGEDMPANRQARDYRNSFQFAAIVSSKGALLCEALRAQLGDSRFMLALRSYYKEHEFGIVALEDLRWSFTRQATTNDERRSVERTFTRWLEEQHGDEDIAPPNSQLAEALGVPARAAVNNNKAGVKRNAPKPNAPNESASRARANRFARVGRFFWKQMTRIR